MRIRVWDDINQRMVYDFSETIHTDKFTRKGQEFWYKLNLQDRNELIVKLMRYDICGKGISQEHKDLKLTYGVYVENVGIIYPDDIVELNAGLGYDGIKVKENLKVEIEDGCFVIGGYYLDEIIWNIRKGQKKMKVIGNIYENFDLLEE